MARDKITEYDSTAANNTVVGDVNLAENSALPSDMNNAVRELMSHQKEAFGSGTPLYVDQTNNRVGIGTASPATVLDVTGNAKLSGTGRILQFDKNGSGTDNVIYYDNSVAANNLYVGKDSSNIIYRTGGSEKVRITSGGSVGIGTTSPSGTLEVAASEPTIRLTDSDNNYYAELRNNNGNLELRADHSNGFAGSVMTFTVDNSEKMRITDSGNVGIGTTSPGSYDASANNLVIYEAGNAGITIAGGTSNNGSIYFADGTAGTTPYRGIIQYNHSSDYMRFSTAATEAARIDSSGNLLVGQSSDPFPGVGNTVQGISLHNSGRIAVSSDGNTTAYLNRKTSDGQILEFRFDGTTVGSIGAKGGDLIIGTGDVGLRFNDANDVIRPIDQSTGSGRDDAIDLGDSSNRFDDIYATNGTIQTSDANEKQDIEALSDAEQRVAVAAKGLLRKYRWKSSVAEKGDEARIHFGIIAQDLKSAFEAEGLDAGRYAMFINSEWTDEETGEQRSRMGVRYNQLLAFIIAAI